MRRERHDVNLWRDQSLVFPHGWRTAYSNIFREVAVFYIDCGWNCLHNLKQTKQLLRYKLQLNRSYLKASSLRSAVATAAEEIEGINSAQSISVNSIVVFESSSNVKASNCDLVTAETYFTPCIGLVVTPRLSQFSWGEVVLWWKPPSSKVSDETFTSRAILSLFAQERCFLFLSVVQLVLAPSWPARHTLEQWQIEISYSLAWLPGKIIEEIIERFFSKFCIVHAVLYTVLSMLPPYF